MTTSRTISLVTPWFGNANGGAEVFCAGLARALKAVGRDVEVLTTCCRDPFHDWSTNQHAPGVSDHGGIAVRRFPVTPRNADRYVALFRRIEQGEQLTAAGEKELLRESINSEKLIEFISGERDRLCFFLPYLYGTTYFGVAAAGADRAFLLPCLHDESFAHLAAMKTMFEVARASLFLSEPEQALAQQLYGLPDEKCFLLGAGVSEQARSGNAEAFRARTGIEGPFVLFVGRKVPGKGADLLVRYFATFLQVFPTENLKLVLIGTGDLDIPRHLQDRIVSADAANSQEVYDAMAACEILVQPSFYESFSLVMMEAWLNRRPVLVNGRCAVTRHHVLHAGGGLWFSTFPEFSETIRLLRTRPDLARRLGEAGEKYVLGNYTWYDTAARFEQFLKTRVESDGL